MGELCRFYICDVCVCVCVCVCARVCARVCVSTAAAFVAKVELMLGALSGVAFNFGTLLISMSVLFFTISDSLGGGLVIFGGAVTLICGLLACFCGVRNVMSGGNEDLNNLGSNNLQV